MTLSLLALVVLPELHLSDKGLIRITPAGFERAPVPLIFGRNEGRGLGS